MQSGCFEIIDHGGFTPALRQDGSKYEVIFVTDGGVGQSRAYWERVEKHLRRDHPTKSKEINALLLQAEAHQNSFDRQGAMEILQKEIDYDLRNQNITTAQGIISKQRNEILPTDVYKVLRLLFINKSLWLSNSIGAVALKMDGAVESVLNEKISPIMQAGANAKTVLLFQKILAEKQIPDFARLYFERILKIEDIIGFRDNVHGQKFRDWYLSARYDPQTVRQILLSRGVSQSIVTKLLRFLIPNAIGVANAPLGIVASVIDSFVIDKMLGGWHPNIFLDDILKSEIDTNVKRHAAQVRRMSIKSRFPSVGRNDPCPCGSGKKFKKCCGSGL